MGRCHQGQDSAARRLQHCRALHRNRAAGERRDLVRRPAAAVGRPEHAGDEQRGSEHARASPVPRGLVARPDQIHERERVKTIVTKQVFAYGLAAGMLLAAGVAGQEAGKVELKLALPKPMFIGTPTNIKSPNLEVITGKSRGAFYVPAGTKLLSLKKPVRSSDMQPVIGELDMVTDGEKSGGDGYFVELGPGKQWVQIDLGNSYALHAILAWHFHTQARVYRDVV